MALTFTSAASDIAAHAEPVTFESEGVTLSGRLFPAAFGDPAPGVAIVGPMTYEMQQAPANYAERLAELGYACLIFDTRYRGESGGEPRCYENPFHKVQDLRAAVGFLAQLPGVDAERLGLLGICTGGGHVVCAAAEDPRVRAVAAITPHFRDPAADRQWLGGDDAIAARRARGDAALARYEETGEVEYVPAVAYDRDDVGMPGQVPWSWYQLWDDRDAWENRYAVMSDASLMRWETLSAAARLHAPYLMLHGDFSAVPDSARRHFARVPATDKRIVWSTTTRHLQYYDDPAILDAAVLEVADWFTRL